MRDRAHKMSTYCEGFEERLGGMGHFCSSCDSLLLFCDDLVGIHVSCLDSHWLGKKKLTKQSKRTVIQSIGRSLANAASALF